MAYRDKTNPAAAVVIERSHLLIGPGRVSPAGELGISGSPGHILDEGAGSKE